MFDGEHSIVTGASAAVGIETARARKGGCRRGTSGPQAGRWRRGSRFYQLSRAAIKANVAFRAGRSSSAWSGVGRRLADRSVPSLSL